MLQVTWALATTVPPLKSVLLVFLSSVNNSTTIHLVIRPCNLNTFLSIFPDSLFNSISHRDPLTLTPYLLNPSVNDFSYWCHSDRQFSILDCRHGSLIFLLLCWTNISSFQQERKCKRKLWYTIYFSHHPILKIYLLTMWERNEQFNTV